MNPEIRKKQPEDRINTVLAALREAEPVPGMEQRLTAALRKAQTKAPLTSSLGWLRTAQLAGVAATVLLSVHAYRRHAAAHQLAPLASTSSQRLPSTAVQPSAAQVSRAIAPEVTPVPNGTTVPVRSAFKGRTVLPTAGTESEPPGQKTAEQGFPAPELPLTEQERLLIRLIHRDDPVQLAQLTPAARETELQRDREQVREFFKPPPMPAANFKLEPYPITGGTP